MYIRRPLRVYTPGMEVTITQFRRDLFKLVEQVMAGNEVHVTYKGKSFSLTPDEPVDRLSRITPLDGIIGDLDDRPDKEAMRLEWEKDWAEL